MAKETRPDVAGRVAMLQQCMPYPSVHHLIEGNQILDELRKDPKAGILIRPIPIQHLRVGVVTDAAWGNVEQDQKFLEENTKDYWEETPVSWVRHHTTPRRIRFHPGLEQLPMDQTYIASDSLGGLSTMRMRKRMTGTPQQPFRLSREKNGPATPCSPNSRPLRRNRNQSTNGSFSSIERAVKEVTW